MFARLTDVASADVPKFPASILQYVRDGVLDMADVLIRRSLVAKIHVAVEMVYGGIQSLL